MLDLVAKKKLGTDLPPDVVDRFNEWCDSCGYTRKAAAVAALNLFQLLPLAVRDAAIRGDWKPLAAAISSERSAEEQARMVAQFGHLIQQSERETKASRRKAKAVPA